jgi:cytochrome b involved in lipid metabolism
VKNLLRWFDTAPRLYHTTFMSKTAIGVLIVVVVLIAGVAVWAFTRTSAPPTTSGLVSTSSGEVPSSTVPAVPPVTATPTTTGGSGNTGGGTTSGPKSYTMTQVAQHNSQASCWSAINGNVYDLTTWIGQHPGGPGNILAICGIDGSAAFNGQHDSQGRPNQILATFKIGVLAR